MSSPEAVESALEVAGYFKLQNLILAAQVLKFLGKSFLVDGSRHAASLKCLKFNCSFKGSNLDSSVAAAVTCTSQAYFVLTRHLS